MLQFRSFSTRQWKSHLAFKWYIKPRTTLADGYQTVPQLPGHFPTLFHRLMNAQARLKPGATPTGASEMRSSIMWEPLLLVMLSLPPLPLSNGGSASLK